MEDLTKVYMDSDIQKELEEIYRQYHNSIKIFIGQLEVLQNKFPVEILNEIRAVFSHIAKLYVCEDEALARHNIEKAKGHIKRAQLDSFKYMCYAYSLYYFDFRDLYKNVDLTYIDNGEFIVKLSDTYATAVKSAEDARKIESMANDGTEAYEAYEEAYCQYAQLYKIIVEKLPVAGKLQQKEKLQKDELDEKLKKLQLSNESLQKEILELRRENESEKRKNKRVTVISVVLAIASVVLGVLSIL